MRAEAGVAEKICGRVMSLCRRHSFAQLAVRLDTLVHGDLL